MARSRKKSSGRAASNAKAASTDSQDAATEPEDVTTEPEDAATSEDDATTAADSGEDPAGAKKGSAKDPVAKKPKGRAAGSGKTAGGEVPEKAKDSTRATSVRRAAAAESSRTTGRRVAAAGQNPQWLAPTAVVLLVLGLAYLVTYYISAGQLPLPIGDWNLAVGFGVLMVGGGMLMFWK